MSLALLLLNFSVNKLMHRGIVMPNYVIVLNRRYVALTCPNRVHENHTILSLHAFARKPAGSA
jgi:hypothetical protein